MMNKLEMVFAAKKKGILNMYCTAGFPKLESTTEVLLALQESGADIIELGMPYSDPVADGPVIQQSNMKALENGISIVKIFEQLQSVKSQLTVPVILMGYLNPVMQFGLEKFCAAAEEAGVSGIILPDLPMYEYETFYQPMFKKHGLHLIFLISPQTSEQRMRLADDLSGGFLYAVSSAATTGKDTSFKAQEPYFKKIKKSKFRLPVLIGFGIKTIEDFETASKYAAGAIIGSAYIKAIEHSTNILSTSREFIKNIKNA